MDELLDSIQNKLEKLQEDVKSLKSPVQITQEKENEIKDELDITREKLMDLMRQKLSTEKIVSICMYSIAYNGVANVTNTYISNQLDINEEQEEKISTILEIFTNPRRIRIIKNLIAKPLHANEISQATGLVGGQLYHHLNILEDANFIEKNNDKYQTNGGTIGLLTALTSLVSGVNMGKEPIDK